MSDSNFSNLSAFISCKDQNKAQCLPYALFWHATLDFLLVLDSPKLYLANATLGTILAFQMSVVKRLEKNQFDVLLANL